MRLLSTQIYLCSSQEIRSRDWAELVNGRRPEVCTAINCVQVSSMCSYKMYRYQVCSDDTRYVQISSVCSYQACKRWQVYTDIKCVELPSVCNYQVCADTRCVQLPGVCSYQLCADGGVCRCQVHAVTKYVQIPAVCIYQMCANTRCVQIPHVCRYHVCTDTKWSLKWIAIPRGSLWLECRWTADTADEVAFQSISNVYGSNHLWRRDLLFLFLEEKKVHNTQ